MTARGHEEDMGIILEKRHLERGAIFFALVGGAMLLCIGATNAIMYVETKPYIYNNAESAPTAEVVVIPGAAVYVNHTLTSIFQNRVDLAIQLYMAKKAQKILVSGDNSTIVHNEVNPVHTYLIAKGIPDQDIFLDHAGFDTYSTMYRAHSIFGVTSMLIASQSFHLPRAVFIARELGIQAYGVDADVGHIPLYNYVREAFAEERAIFDVLLMRKPKYLGDPIPITGDGSAHP